MTASLMVGMSTSPRACWGQLAQGASVRATSSTRDVVALTSSSSLAVKWKRYGASPIRHDRNDLLLTHERAARVMGWVRGVVDFPGHPRGLSTAASAPRPSPSGGEKGTR